MLTKKTLEKYDTTRMFEIYDNWPNIARETIESNVETKNFGSINHLVFAGMGGSGALGDLFLSLLSKTPIHTTIVKGYLLPKTIDLNTLIVATSVSGNTEETLSIVKKAKNLNCKLICFSSGGKLEKFCKKNKIFHQNVKLYGNPRSSFPAFVYSILEVLKPIIPIKKNSIEKSILEMESLSKIICSNNLTKTNLSLKLAEWLDDIPVIYYPWGLQAAAIRFKNSIQENTKTHAMIEDVIEACHNGIVSWETKSKIKPILIRGEDDHLKTKERWEILKSYFKKNKIEFWEIKSVQGDVLSKLINLIYLLDFATVYLAAKKRVDPFPVKSINFVKQHL